MNRSLKLSFVSVTTLFGAAIVVACSSAPTAEDTTGGAALSNDVATLAKAPIVPSGCNAPHKAAVGGHAQASCFSVHLDSTTIAHPAVVHGQATTTPSGFGPADLQSAYNLPASFAPDSTVAVVDAQDNPNAEADLAVYRKQYGLPGLHHGERLLQEGRPERHVDRPADGQTVTGRARSRSTSTWSRPRARAARSCSSRPTARTTTTSRPASTRPSPSAPRRSPTATAGTRTAAHSRMRPTTPTPASS